MTIVAVTVAAAFILAAAPAVANTDVIAGIEKAIDDLKQTDKKLKKDVRQLAKQVEALQKENEKQQKQIKNLKGFRGDAREDISDADELLVFMELRDSALEYLASMPELRVTNPYITAEKFAREYLLPNQGVYKGSIQTWHHSMSLHRYMESSGLNQPEGQAVMIGGGSVFCFLWTQPFPESTCGPDYPDSIQLVVMEGSRAWVQMYVEPGRLTEFSGVIDMDGVEMNVDHLGFANEEGYVFFDDVSPGVYDLRHEQYNGTLIVKTYPAYGIQ